MTYSLQAEAKYLIKHAICPKIGKLRVKTQMVFEGSSSSFSCLADAPIMKSHFPFLFPLKSDFGLLENCHNNERLSSKDAFLELGVLGLPVWSLPVKGPRIPLELGHLDSPHTARYVAMSFGALQPS